jgi:hypothetical protein
MTFAFLEAEAAFRSEPADACGTHAKGCVRFDS